MKEKDIEQIERYFRKALEGKERAAFERRMAEDAGFAQEVRLHGLALEAIRMEGEALLRARLAQKGKQLDEQAPAPGRRKWLWALPIVLLGALCIWWFTRPPAGPAPQVPAPAVPQAPAHDTLPPAPQPQVDPEEGAQTENGDMEQRLFAAWFRPYKDESLDPAVRGDGEATPEEHFLQLYWEGKYRPALAAFNQMEPESQEKGDLRFLKANALLAVGNTREAIPLLEDTRRTRFAAERAWRLALAYLKSGEREKALTQLKSIAFDTDALHQSDAERLMKVLQ